MALLSVATLMLGGCETGGLTFNGGGGAAQPQANLNTPPPKPVAQTRVALAPVIGAPDGVSKQLHQDFSSAIGQRNVVVVPAQDKPDFAIRGYVVAAKDKTNTKISYIWDLTDPQGQRVNRITGEEIVAAAGTDPWASVTQSVSQSIAKKSADSLSNWFAQNAKPAATPASAPVAATQSAQQTAALGKTPVVPQATSSAQTASIQPAPPPQAVSSQTSKPQPAMVSTAVPTLTGAPGDGNALLANALQSELSKAGVAAAGPGAAAYRVEGVVVVGSANAGKQPVQIDWNVKDPQGKRLGTVTQKNEVVAGSLDASWGKTADAAASAAAQGILKLLPKQTAAN